MTALAAAVIPIIRLLVAVATRNGTPIDRCMSGTLMIPPRPEQRGCQAGAHDALDPAESPHRTGPVDTGCRRPDAAGARPGSTTGAGHPERHEHEQGRKEGNGRSSTRTR
jgi:hypothetical protein